jgi:hypothetical protein
MTRNLVPILLLGLVMGGAEPNSIAATRDRAGLKGISSFGVVIEKLPADFNLKESQLQSFVELTLRLGRLKIVSLSEQPQAIVYVALNAVANRDTRQWAYNVQLELLQSAVLSRDREMLISTATTWNKSEIAMIGAAIDLPHHVNGTLSDLLLAFLNDYLAANQ